MKINMTNLPGVGKKISFINGEEKMLVMIIHYTGKRELYFFDDYEDDEAIFSYNLSAEETKQLGAQLLGSNTNTDISENLERMKKVQKQVIVEWVDVTKRSPIVGKSFSELKQLLPVGVSLIGFFRNEEFIVTPPESSLLETKDTIMVVGKHEYISKFLKQCEEKS